MTHCKLLACAAVVFCFLVPGGPAFAADSAPDEFTFDTAGDMRLFVGPGPDGKHYFDGVCAAIKKVGAGDFMISPGDCDPPAPVAAMVRQYLGSNYTWYPVIGNHDAEKPANMAWIRHWSESGIVGLARRGPKGAEDTIYSFDHGNSHFVMINEYYDGSADALGRGEIPDATLKWLREDLAATSKPLIWVSGHKPIKSMPDIDTGRMRHADDPITSNAAQMKQFLDLLKEFHVRAYICGHTHDASVAKVEGIWQADSGHARGAGDKGAPSTFLKFHVSGLRTSVDIYRGDAMGVEYRLRKTVELK